MKKPGGSRIEIDRIGVVAENFPHLTTMNETSWTNPNVFLLEFSALLEQFIHLDIIQTKLRLGFIFIVRKSDCIIFTLILLFRQQFPVLFKIQT